MSDELTRRQREVLFCLRLVNDGSAGDQATRWHVHRYARGDMGDVGRALVHLVRRGMAKRLPGNVARYQITDAGRAALAPRRS